MRIIKKLVIKSLALALPILFAGNLQASISNTIKIETNAEEKSIYLSFLADDASTISIQIKDENKAILHKEKVTNQNTFSKKFNLENLPKGDYFLEISDELKDVIQPIEVSDSTVEMNPSDRTLHYKPVYKFQNNLMNINFLALNNDKLNIEISNDRNLVIFTQEFKTGGNPFEQRFNLSKLNKGDYTIKIVTDYEVYYKTITVE